MSTSKKGGAGSKTIAVDYLARVEGEGGLHVRLKDGQVQDVQLRIFEPPRLFEAFLEGRHFNEVPDITARICGICPIAYQMSAVHAMEQILGIQIDPSVRALRRLFYCGEWIESHTLHVYLLHAPDFLGAQDAIELARKHRALVEQGLRLKKIGNHLVEVMGGREIHPVSAAVGGFYRTPTRRELGALVEDLKWALDASIATAKAVAGFHFPDFEQDYEFVSLSHPDEYPFNEGRIVSSKGVDIGIPEYLDHFVEQHVKHSTALQARVKERGSYLVGPLARFNLNYDKLPPVARQVAEDCGLSLPCRNPFQSIVVRAVELVFACHEALRIIAEYEPPAAPRVEAAPRAGVGHGATEAPRGLLYHRYEIDDRGLVVKARIVPPTAQNLKRMEDDLWHFVPQIKDQPIERVTWQCEQAVRNYDPCISCSAHFLRLTLEEEGAPGASRKEIEDESVRQPTGEE
jgi:coenzyme F420-reducing hydrogenase alpha subunit